MFMLNADFHKLKWLRVLQTLASNQAVVVASLVCLHFELVCRCHAVYEWNMSLAHAAASYFSWEAHVQGCFHANERGMVARVQEAPGKSLTALILTPLTRLQPLSLRLARASASS